MQGGFKMGRVLAVLALLATIFVALPANAQDEPDDVGEVCIRVRGRITADLASGELQGRLGSRLSRYPLTGTTTDNGDGTFSQRYVLDVGPFLEVRETPTGSFPLRSGATIFFSSAEVTGGANSGRLAYVGRVNRAGTTARYQVFGRVCGWGPDTVVTNGSVYTVGGGVEEAVAVQDGRIIRVGTEVEILETFIAGSTVDVIDAQGNAVIPAFVDAHSHVWEGAVDVRPSELEDERFAQGVTTVGEPTVIDADIARLRRIAAADDLRLRTRMWVGFNTFCGDVREGAPHLSASVSRDPSAMFGVLGTKIFSDGGACNAPAVSFPYQPGIDPLPPSPQGDLYLSQEALTEVVADADRLGHQVIIHAIGDVGVETAASALADIIDGSGNPSRHRIEHNVLVRPEILDLYVANDIGAVIFGEYNTCLHNEGGWWAQHLAPDQIDWLYPWRAMVDAGVTVGWQADVPSFTRNALHHWYSLASLGQAEAAAEFGGPGPCAAPAELASHALTMAEALEAMTLGSATLMHLDSEIGSIEAGKAADLVILDSDPIGSGAVTTLLDTNVALTMSRGDTVYCDAALVACSAG